jgi:hypothetical protein
MPPWWNTGCNNIGNALNCGINIVDGENQSLAITVPSKGSANWQSVIFPWCNSKEEVFEKAFHVHDIDNGRLFMFLFQEYETSKICWSLVLDTDPWSDRRVINDGLNSHNEQRPSSALDIFIMADKVWGLPATSENQVFNNVFGQVLAIGNTVGAIASAVAAIASA